MTQAESWLPSEIERQREFLDGELFATAAPDLMVGGMSSGGAESIIIQPPGFHDSWLFCTLSGCTDQARSCTSYCLCSGNSCSTFPRNC
jgi:hypothetical protein